MNWATLLIAIQQMSPVEAMLTTIMVVYFVYRGGINLIIPVIKKSKVKKSKEQPSRLLSIHESCPNFTSFGVILKEVMNISDKIFRIRYQDTLYNQMNDAEIMWDKTKSLLKENFKRTYELENSDTDRPEKTNNIHLYEVIIDSMETEMMGLIRRWMRKNHFVQKNDVEYSAYIKEKIELLYDRMSSLFDDRYDENKLKVNRDILEKTMKENVLFQIKDVITMFFLNAKTIAEETNEKIKELEKEIENI